jgi:hypothetical protein
VAKDLYIKFGKTAEAMRCAIKANDIGAINEIFNACEDGYAINI